MAKIIPVRNNMVVSIMDNGTKVLTSYTTNVAEITADGKFNRLWNGYSATTMRHVNDFRAMYGMDKLNKAAWLSL